MPRPTSTRIDPVDRLQRLQDKAAARRAQRDAEARKLRRAQTAVQREAWKLHRQRWQAAGELVESLGLPLDLAALRAVLAPLAANGRPGSGLAGTATRPPGSPAEPGQDARTGTRQDGQ